ncbi:reticulon-3-like isoform X4 [Biomphalaria glabrata]|uniref:Reticulon-like protein n=1 Tax=Biomphalaria glabrata TaxID=6526 RepID=A0A9U8E2X7_BIOGL|nr:reticulon-3-like isoform X4 [Biomphalaria glabrata]
MASTNPSNQFDNQPESSGYGNDDFEKLDPPGSGFEHDNLEGEELDYQSGIGSSGAYDFDINQDTHISTTTDITEEAEEDRYGAGASEAEAYAHTQSLLNDPTVGLEDYGFNDEDLDYNNQVEPSAPVPDSNEQPLIDFDSTSDPDSHPTFATSAPPTSSHYPESFPSSTTTSSKGKGAYDDFEALGDTKTDSPTKEVKSTEPIFEETSSTKGSWLKGVDPRVKDLIYWRDVKKTGVVFGSLLLILVSLAIFSVLSVIAYLSLAVLTVTFSFVVYKKIMAAVQKSNDGHPFKPFLEMDISLSESKLKSVIQSVLKNVNCLTHELRRLFLIEDIVDSIKFGLLLWVLTYIGSWFSGMFLIILDIVLLFTVPKVYETYQVQIDNYIGLAKAQVNNIITIIQSKLPFLKKKDKSQ